MLNYRLLQQRAPLNVRDERKRESLPAYLARIAPLEPFIPENVLFQWIYRHWRRFESNWSFIDLASHQFTCDSWPTTQLVEQVDSRHMAVIERRGELLRSNRYVRRSWLGEKMPSEGHRPEQLIMLVPATGISYPNRHPLPRPYCLLEGHHRLGYLRAMARDGEPQREIHKE